MLNDIGTEELAHLEMVGSMVKQLTRNASIESIEAARPDAYYVDHDKAVYPVSAAGVPFPAAYLQFKGDPAADLMEDMAAEQKARATYERLINLADDPDVIEPLKFLREREVVHFQRFGEALRIVQEFLESKRIHPVAMPQGKCAIKIQSQPRALRSPGRGSNRLAQAQVAYDHLARYLLLATTRIAHLRLILYTIPQITLRRWRHPPSFRL